MRHLFAGSHPLRGALARRSSVPRSGPCEPGRSGAISGHRRAPGSRTWSIPGSPRTSRAIIMKAMAGDPHHRATTRPASSPETWSDLSTVGRRADGAPDHFSAVPAARPAALHVFSRGVESPRDVAVDSHGDLSRLLPGGALPFRTPVPLTILWAALTDAGRPVCLAGPASGGGTAPTPASRSARSRSRTAGTEPRCASGNRADRRRWPAAYQARASGSRCTGPRMPLRPS